MYISDVGKICENSQIMLFADHTVLYTSNANGNIAIIHMQRDINNVVTWCNKNKFTINIDKTKYMGFGSKKCYKNAAQHIDHVRLSMVPNYKYLDIYLDPKVSYEIFIKARLNTIAYRTYQITKLNKFMSTKNPVTLYKVYILPIMDYGDILFPGGALKFYFDTSVRLDL